MCEIIENIKSDAVIARIKGEVAELCRRFPVYGN